MSGDTEINVSQRVGSVRDEGQATAVGIERAGNVYVTTADLRPPLWVNVPGLRAHFLGRENLVQGLAERLTAGEPVSLAAHGLPGAGKSTLAARLAHLRLLLGFFEDGVLWAGLGPQGDVGRLLGQWALALGEDVADLSQIEARRQAVRRLVAQRRLLFVIDDAWDAEAAELLRCGGPRCAYLLTTRQRDVARAFAGAGDTVSVPPLEPDPAVTLLQELAPEAYAADPRAVAQLVEATGRLPLALELVGGYLGAEERSLWPDLAQEALVEMADPQRRLQLATRRLGAAADKKETLQETITLSVDSLPQEAQRTFYALGAFAPRPESFTRDAAVAVAEAEAKTLALLVARNLLELNDDGDLALHQMLADVAGQKTPAASVTRHREHYLALADEDHDDWRRIEAVYGQIRRAWDQVPEDQSLLGLVRALEIYQRRRGRWQDYHAWVQKGLDVARASGLREDERKLLNNLGWIHNSVGLREKALAYHQQALTISEEMGDRPGLADTLDHIGQVYDDIGQYEQALEVYQRAQELWEELEDRSGLGETLNNIGAVYDSMTRYEKALTYYKRALTISEELEDRPELATNLNNIGLANDNLGRREEALESYAQALVIYETVGDRPGIATTLGNMGAAYDSLGQYEEALAHYGRALTIQEEVGDRLGLARNLGNKGVAYDNLRQHEEALESYAQALLFYEKVGDRPGMATTLGNMGVAYDNLGQHEEALASYKRALAIYEEVEDRPEMATMLNKIGDVYGNLGLHEEALAYYERDLTISEEMGDKPGQAVTLDGIGRVYDELDRSEEALAYYERALAIYEEIGDRSGESVTRYNLAMIHYVEDNLRAAVAELRRATELATLLGSQYQELFAEELADVEAELAAEEDL